MRKHFVKKNERKHKIGKKEKKVQELKYFFHVHTYNILKIKVCKENIAKLKY